MRDKSTNLRIAIALAFLAVVALGVLTIRNTNLIRDDEKAMARASSVTLTLLELFSAIQDAERGQRGYLLTATPEYLDPYHAGLAETAVQTAKLRSLIEDNPAQLARIDELDALVNARTQELTEAISQRQSQPDRDGFDRVVATMKLGRGRELMQQIRAVITEIRQEEQRLSALFEGEARTRSNTSKLMIIVSNILALSLILWAGLVAAADRRQRDRAEQQLRSGRAELAGIVDSAMMSVITFGYDLRIRRMNPAAEAMHRWQGEVACGHSMLDLLPDRMRNAFADNIRNFIDSPDSSRVLPNGQAMRSDGSEFPYEGTLTKSVAEGDAFITFMAQDLTERQTGRAAMRERDAMLEQIHDAIHVCDMHDRITFWNHAAEVLYGIPATRAIGSNAVDLIYSHSADVWHASRSQLLQEDSVTSEMTQRTAAGEEIIVEHRRSLIRSHEGVPIGQLVINLDITQRKQEEASERRAQRLQSIGTLAGGIAHDLNNVLTPILMSGKLLKRSDANRQRLAETIVTSATRGAEMIRKILSFAGGKHGTGEQVDLSHVVAEAANILEHTLPKGIRLKVNLSEPTAPVLGNATELSQVVMNLAINARDAMPDGGQLVIELKSCDVARSRAERGLLATLGPQVALVVSDTGCGIPKQHIERIFDPFFTTKPQDKGTGLGLATTLGIVRSHGGDISVHSQPGRGTQFTVWLPCASQPLPRGEAPAETARPSMDGQGETVLLVDDEPLILETTRNMLETHGYQVMTARGGAEAIAKYHREQLHVDLAIIDIMMPGVDGLDTKDALRAQHPGLKLIASSGLRGPASADGRLSDIDGFLAKPYSDEHLLQLVRQVLDAPGK